MVCGLNKTEKEIVALFLKEPYESYTEYGIAKHLNRYISQVQNAVENLQKLKVISVKKLGNKTKECSIDFLTSDLDILSSISIYSKERKCENDLKIRVITKEIEKEVTDCLYSMILFGSHAKGTANSKSDIDLCFIIQNESEVENFKNKIKSILSNYDYKVHINVFTVEWFKEMLNERGTIGKEILKSSIVLHGHDFYYTMVKNYVKKTGH